jgi:endoglucanase
MAMREKSLRFLHDLLSTPSPSGWEQEIQKRWIAQAEKIADEVRTDAYGNAVAILNPGGGPRAAFYGHADEIGFQIIHVTDDGFLHFSTLGGVDHTLALGQRVTVHSERGPVHGVVGSVPIHLQDRSKDSKAPALHELYIDIGCRTAKEALKRVNIGDPVTYSAGVLPLGDDLLVARGCDNRIGIFAALETLRKAREQGGLKACLMAVSTVQEENGLYGAAMAGQTARADVAVVIDVGHATDIPGCDPKKHGKVSLGGGPILSRGSVNHPLVVRRLQKTAEKAGIRVQMATDPRRSGTDADEIFKQHGGVPTAVVSLPNRYMHSPVEMIHLGDLDRLSDLTAAFSVDLRAGQRFNHRLS